MYATPENGLLLIAAGAGAGVLGAVLGIGGGVFLIPVLVVGFKMPMHDAVATSLLSVIGTSCAVGSANVERGTANMRLGMVLEIATAAGGLLGGLTAALLAARTLEGLFAALMVITGLLMWRGGGEEAGAGNGQSAGPENHLGVGALGGQYIDPMTRKTVSYRVQRLWAGLSISFLAGNISGLLGVGGGVFKVPALNLFCGVPIKAAAATSNFMIGVTAAASASLYFGRGDVRPALTAAVVLGVLVGSVAGSLLNRYIGGPTVRRLFAVLLFVVAVQMLVRAIWVEGE